MWVWIFFFLTKRLSFMVSVLNKRFRSNLYHLPQHFPVRFLGSGLLRTRVFASHSHSWEGYLFLSHEPGAEIMAQAPGPKHSSEAGVGCRRAESWRPCSASGSQVAERHVVAPQGFQEGTVQAAKPPTSHFPGSCCKGQAPCRPWGPVDASLPARFC